MSDNFVVIVCPNCQQERTVSKSNLRKKNHTGYCRTCYHKFLRPRGENNPCWKGGRAQSQARWNSKESSKELKRKYYKDNRQHILIRNIKHNANFKLEVLTHYSTNPPCCAKCGITDIDVLTIDHISGGGSAHKKILGGSLGRKLYLWLKYNGFPAGYQVLCFNCNFKKSLMEKREQVRRTRETTKVV